MSMDAYWICYKKVTRDFKEFVLTLAIPYYASIEIGNESHGGIARVSDVKILKAETLSGEAVDKDTFYSLYDWQFQADMASSKGIYCVTDVGQARRFMARKGDV
jgi:hypothetical protein